jgi:hypothetical protein
MAKYEHLPIFKAMMDLAIEVERAVQHFPRSHKYALGAELRALWLLVPMRRMGTHPGCVASSSKGIG